MISKDSDLELKIQLASENQCTDLFGPADRHLRMLCSAMHVEISARDANVIIAGDKPDVEDTAGIIDRMQKRLVKRGKLSEPDVRELITQTQHNIKGDETGPLIVYSPKGIIEPFTSGQAKYIEAMQKKDLTFCTGPAGTGKTYLAVANAVAMLKRKSIRKIILARPAVEAGERLGFLPGDLQAKVNPYLRPLFDSLEDMMQFDQMRKFLDRDIIEIIPLAFMRGRTLNEAMVICDEAQNTSTSQMMMMLTRLGRGSKMVITGDITQIDLEKGHTSGMIDAVKTLKGIKGIGFVELEKADIVRHTLVQNIVQAYDRKNKHS